MPEKGLEMSETSINGFKAELEHTVEVYSNSVSQDTSIIASNVAKRAAGELQKTSPRRSGKYARGWAVRKEDKTKFNSSNIVHNKSKYQLTHLLEHGHVGKLGRKRFNVSAKPHIAKAEKKAIEEFENELKEAIEK